MRTEQKQKNKLQNISTRLHYTTQEVKIESVRERESKQENKTHHNNVNKPKTYTHTRTYTYNIELQTKGALTTTHNMCVKLIGWLVSKTTLLYMYINTSTYTHKQQPHAHAHAHAYILTFIQCYSILGQYSREKKNFMKQYMENEHK